MVIEPFTCSATQTWNGSCILGDVVRDSLKSKTMPILFFEDSTWSLINIKAKIFCLVFKI